MKILVKNYVLNKAYYKDIIEAPHIGSFLDGGVVKSFREDIVELKSGTIEIWVVEIVKESIFSRFMKALGF